ncbi:MAG TPA: hypothetical protein VGG22_13560 [Candidatus Baltobacteraceae bacterium]
MRRSVGDGVVFVAAYTMCAASLKLIDDAGAIWAESNSVSGTKHSIGVRKRSQGCCITVNIGDKKNSHLDSCLKTGAISR